MMMQRDDVRTILVVDDEEKNRLAISAVLRHAPEPYLVITAPNGLVGCKMAEAQKPNLIIMDWVMPEMSGLEALMVLKERETTHDIPVIMLTGLGSSKHVEYALNAGAADYLRIPVDKTELLARVRAAIALAESYSH
ncbi:MAG: response regulator, partial [Candidatus Kapaibacteriota bacterium]